MSVKKSSRSAHNHILPRRFLYTEARRYLMSKVNNENFVAIQGWMVTELGLKGNSLLIYAIIYGFSQTENQVFTGSLQYLADWTNSTKQGVLQNIKKLLEAGFIGKNEKIINGVKFCEYYAKKLNGVLNKVEWGIKQSLTNNIEDNIENNKENDTNVSLAKAEYGNKEINEMFDIWKQMFNYTPPNSPANRRAVYNMLKSKDKGKQWVINTMRILKEAQKDRYAGKDVNGASNFVELQRNYDKIWLWGGRKAQELNQIKTSIEI